MQHITSIWSARARRYTSVIQSHRPNKLCKIKSTKFDQPPFPPPHTWLRMKTDVAVDTKLLRIQYSPSAEGTLRENHPIMSGKNFRTWVNVDQILRNRGERGGRKVKNLG